MIVSSNSGNLYGIVRYTRSIDSSKVLKYSKLLSIIEYVITILPSNYMIISDNYNSFKIRLMGNKLNITRIGSYIDRTDSRIRIVDIDCLLDILNSDSCSIDFKNRPVRRLSKNVKRLVRYGSVNFLRLYIPNPMKTMQYVTKIRDIGVLI